ncbi:hypothetical protein [Adhaeretor mobilis]|uniref:Uncharacterized protein n=1 Tax=Adhaeretor mobilis TaxID=1930276 RepID=A0A517MSF5_9BACT|nr:hypothetical protein [Adhaeretor mobilis]QDS97812.1 hypothetical protein HG15A2_10790 [Adhaeretor mobilis]
MLILKRPAITEPKLLARRFRRAYLNKLLEAVHAPLHGDDQLRHRDAAGAGD